MFIHLEGILDSVNKQYTAKFPLMVFIYNIYTINEIS